MARKKIFQSILFALMLSAIPSVAYAHDGTNLPLGGFLSGIVHPVLGIGFVDHIVLTGIHLVFDHRKIWISKQAG